jgi:hypothetical protein
MEEVSGNEMTTENEEFEFRLRREKEKAAQRAQTPSQKILGGIAGAARFMQEQGESQAIGVGRGLKSTYEGVTQPFRSPEFSQQAQAERDFYERLKSQEPVSRRAGMGIGEVIGETAPYAVIPGATAGASLPARMGAGMATGLVVGGTQFVPPSTLGQGLLQHLVGLYLVGLQYLVLSP